MHFNRNSVRVSWAGLGLVAVLGLTILIVLGSQSAVQAASSAQLKLLQSDPAHIVLELDVSGYDSSESNFNGVAYTALSIPGLGHTSDSGKPQLPIKGALVAIPPGAQPSIKILADQAQSVSLAHPPVPAPTEQVQFNIRETLPRYQDTTHIPNAAAYSVNQFYPADAAKIALVGNWRSQHYATVEFHPLQYNPATRQLTFHQSVRVEITLSYPNGLTSAALGTPLDEGSFETVFQKSFVNYESAKNWRARSAPVGNPHIGSVYSGGPWYRIGVNADGVYQITCPALAAVGINPSTLDPTKLQIFKNGTELAINVRGTTWSTCDNTDYVEFFGQAPNAKYTNTNIYWLTYGQAPGKRIAQRNGGGTGTAPASGTVSLHLEQNMQYVSTTPVTEGFDHFYWNFAGPDYGISSRNYTFQIPHPANVNANASLQLDLVGYNAGDHQTEIAMNGNLIDNTHWTGMVERRATITFPMSYLSPLTNTITFTETKDYPLDAAFANYFDVGYESTFDATNDTLRFVESHAGSLQYQINGFDSNNIEAFDVTDPMNVAQIVNGNVSFNGSTYSLEYADSISAPTQYLTLAISQRLTPSITRDIPASPSLHDPSNGADYLIISYGGFLPDIQPLATYRASQGLRVKVVDVQNVYDEFSDGLVDAQAVHDFLAFAYANWQPPAPSFVLLVGGGNFDPKGYCSPPNTCVGGVSTPPNSTFIPPYLRVVDPLAGETDSDNRLVAFDQYDTLPDMAIGRLPAGSAGDVDAMVAKILNYEKNPPTGNLQTNVSFVTDRAYDQNGNLDGAGNFWAFSDLVASNPNLMPAPNTPARIYYNPCNPNVYPQCFLPYPSYPTPGSARAAIISGMSDGRLIVNYVGHGSITQWGKDDIFDENDIPGLNNGNKTPVMIEMTCYTGFFQFPGAQSLAQMNVLLPANGAVASWAATGLGVGAGHDLLDEGFFGAVMQQGVYQIGPATVLGKTNLWLNGGGQNLDLIDTFVLLGDPATRLDMPQADVAITKKVSPTGPVTMGSPITFTLTFTNNGPGLAERVVITDTLAQVLLSPSFTSSGVPITPTGGTNYAWYAGSLVPQAGGVITVNAVLDPDRTHYGSMTLVNQATISTVTRESNGSNDQSATTTPIWLKYFLPLIIKGWQP